MEKEINWSLIRTHSEVEITLRHMFLFQSTINFEKFEAKILTRGNDLKTLAIELSIDPGSLNTFHNSKPDPVSSKSVADHAKTRFVSGTIERPDRKGNHVLPGRLTIRGITRFVQLKIRFTRISHDPWGDATTGFTITGTLKRRDWGLDRKIFAEQGIFFLSNLFTVSCKIHMSKINQEKIINDQAEGFRNAKMVYSKKFNISSSAAVNDD